MLSYVKLPQMKMQVGCPEQFVLENIKLLHYICLLIANMTISLLKIN